MRWCGPLLRRETGSHLHSDRICGSPTHFPEALRARKIILNDSRCCQFLSFLGQDLHLGFEHDRAVERAGILRRHFAKFEEMDDFENKYSVVVAAGAQCYEGSCEITELIGESRRLKGGKGINTRLWRRAGDGKEGQEIEVKRSDDQFELLQNWRSRVPGIPAQSQGGPYLRSE
ncbi:hypothetical protein VTN31DRAFT_3548 [Thermomyces dupontii]|uniref:uncharacterized protein n=1 Tax=Talaromyces thermophilus TaxID=28565 RepID=UPI0037444819